MHEDVKRFYYGFPKDAHPMATTASVVNALATFYQDSEDPHDPEQVQLSIVRLMAKLPTVAAYSYKQSIGQPFLYPDNSLDLIENFLRMMFAVPSEPFEVSPTIVHALKQLLILHADHEQNCSTSTVRIVGSADANLYASIAAGVDALWGPLHGGANQACVEMLEDIRDHGGDVNEAVRRAKDPHDDFRLSGFGHRVYKNYDPRAKILKSTAERVLERAELEGRALRHRARNSKRSRSPTTTSSRRSCTRTSTSTPASSTGRWASPPTCSRCCSRSAACPAGSRTGGKGTRTPKTKIGRPRQIYTGPVERKYVPIDQRD